MLAKKNHSIESRLSRMDIEPQICEVMGQEHEYNVLVFFSSRLFSFLNVVNQV